MSEAPALAALRGSLEALSRQYEAHFAGQPRVSRDPVLMATMRDEAARIVEALTSTPVGAERDTLLQTALEAKRLYTQETAAITQSQSQGPEALDAHRLSTWVHFATRRYVRHFAGKSRLTRDAALLSELVADLERLGEDITALSQDFQSVELTEARTLVDQNLKLYRSERTQIGLAREALSTEEQVDTLAQLANDQFQLYADHFAGKSRQSRRPVLLQRIVDNLKEVRERMQSVALTHPQLANNQKNIEIVSGRLEFYSKELEEIRKVRESTQFQDLVGSLGGAANQIFDEYKQHFAGQDRKTRELNRLSKVCDQLYEIAHQMDDLDRVRENETNIANLQIVLDNLRMYEREFDEIRKVQQAT
jgi:division protein CdvB (Snf7/Vps24/ESCRT-III family)